MTPKEEFAWYPVGVILGLASGLAYGIAVVVFLL